MGDIIAKIVEIDIYILQFIVDNLKVPFLDFLMPIVTLFGEGGIFWIICTVICLAFPKTRKMGFTMALALTLGIIFGNGIIKNVVARPRPYTLEQFKDLLLVSELSDWSFPSGHTLASFEASVSIFAYRKRWGAVALAIALLVALSRPYLMVHFPSDVIAGAILGTVFAIVSYFVIKYLYNRFDLENKLLFPFERKKIKQNPSLDNSTK